MIFLIIILTMIFLVITFDIFLLVTILHQLANKAMARDSSWSPEVEPPGAVRGAVVGARWWGRDGGGSDSSERGAVVRRDSRSHGDPATGGWILDTWYLAPET